MQHFAAKIHKLLLGKNQTLAVAESCTGGLLSSLLTARSGSSAFFILGAVVYSNFSKNLLLKIPSETISKHGAVSPVVAAAMADNIRRIAKTDYGIGITGIAGPTGGSRSKPVGTVFIAVSSRNRTICRSFRFKGSRRTVRNAACLSALKMLQYIIIY